MITISVAFQDQKTPSSLTVITSSKISRSSSMVKGPTAASGFGDGIEEAVTRFEKKGNTVDGGNPTPPGMYKTL